MHNINMPEIVGTATVLFLAGLVIYIVHKTGKPSFDDEC